ncbi:MAG: Phosphoserine phosphatase, partial [Ilumatobacteraceae bacterium]|nr:Phosphoserine phosphatase [Ilumatobacteraceae bacterium]
TGRMAGDNCRGPEKVRRLRAWLADHQLTDAELWAYGDSNGDRELLAAAAHALMVKGVRVTAVPADAR